jgi:DNA replication protein DnaC
METLSSISTKIAEWARRCAERSETPEFQAHAERLRLENAIADEVSRETQRKLNLQAAGVPGSLWDKVRQPAPGLALDAAREFLVSPRECVFLALAGPAGRGKTFAAAWAVSERDGRYAVAHDLVTAGSFDPVWRELAETPVLALDEVGAEYRNSAFDASLYTLLNARHAHQRKTILCTNLDADGFKARYCPKPEDPLRDRLRTAARWVNLPGESMRKPWTDTEREP